MRKRDNGGRDGFTLIELSIVLVIIGLLVGGVLVGQNLLKQAHVRQTIAQIDQYKIAVRQFKERFDYYPGDLPEPYATINFGDRVCFPQAGAYWLQGGNGDSIISRPEGTLVFCQLAIAGFINGGYAKGGAAIFPSAAWGQNMFIQIPFYNASSNNNCGMGTTDSCFLLSNCSNCGSDSGAGVTPLEGNTIDLKIDDGFPLTGRVIGRRSIYEGYSNSDNCEVNSSTNIYQLTSFQPSCAMTFKID